MSWMSQLFKTYENNIGKNSSSDHGLTPVAHMNANAQIEVTLNLKGEFKRAVVVGKGDAVTLIPVTESSAGRSSGVAPHGLCDTLSYIAGDFSEHCENEKQRKSTEEKFQNYCANLEKWAKSKYSHPKVQAVYNYISKKSLISDLEKDGIIELKVNGVFENKKISGQPYEKALVRFRIFSEDGEKDGTWEDASLIQTYTRYYLEGQKGKNDICYFTGEAGVISENHPKGILASDYGAKLVSANDAQGYTYRGRFQNAEQSCTLSYEASQKIHSALTWIAKNQGVFVGSKDKRTFICWNPNGKKTPELLDEFGLFEEEDAPDLVISYRKKLRRAFQGYKEQFDETDEIIVMGLDAATTGRLSVTYYHELKASDFLENMIYWGETCNWFFLKFNEKKKPYYAVETPVFRKIVECAFGREKGNFIEADDKVLKVQTQRLMKCMLERERVPFDIVHALAIRASTPMAYTRGNRERVLSTACALIHKFYYEKFIAEGDFKSGMPGAPAKLLCGGGMSAVGRMKVYYENKGERQEDQDNMKLDLDNHDRSYLFGRLLAVYEFVERITYEKGESREPNAIRLQSVYVNHPMQTWKVLEGLLDPYFRKLNPGLRKYYRGMINNIVTSFDSKDEKKMNQGLKENYLLGYYLQRAELTKKKEESKDDESAKQD